MTLTSSGLSHLPKLTQIYSSTKFSLQGGAGDPTVAPCRHLARCAIIPPTGHLRSLARLSVALPIAAAGSPRSGQPRPDSGRQGGARDAERRVTADEGGMSAYPFDDGRPVGVRRLASSLLPRRKGPARAGRRMSSGDAEVGLGRRAMALGFR